MNKEFVAHTGKDLNDVLAKVSFRKSCVNLNWEWDWQDVSDRYIKGWM